MRIRLLILILLLCALPAFAQNANLNGTVRSAEAGVPLADMTVAAYNSAGFLTSSTLTDGQGRYFLTLAPGTYRILAYDRNGLYATSFYKGATSFETSEAINVSTQQTLDINFLLQRGLQITGSIRDENGAPLPGATVVAYNPDGSRRSFTSAGANGSYTLVVPAGSYRIVAFHESLPYVPKFYDDGALFESATAVTAPAARIDLSLSRGVKVRGAVVDNKTNTPIAGVTVTAYDLQGNVRERTITDNSGQFALVLPPGTYKFSTDDPKQVYQTTFFRDSSTFASGAALALQFNVVPPDLDFVIGRKPDGKPKTTLFVAAAANAAGGFGTFFRTDVWLYNPSDTDLAVTATFLRAGQDNSAVSGVQVLVPSRQQVQLTDILKSVFGTDGTGALRFEAVRDFHVTSRTYNVPANSAQAGTFGLSLPGQSVAASLGRATLAGLSNNASSRTNIGLLNPQPNAINVRVQVFAADGSAVADNTVTLKPLEWFQGGGFVPADTDNAYAIVSSVEGSFFSYASVVDNKSGDGTIILPTAE